MDTTLEVLPVGGRDGRNRKWPDEMKARIVAETLLPSATVNGVAQRYGVSANHVSSWRTLAKQGRLVLPAPNDPVEFAMLMVDDAKKQQPGDEKTDIPMRPEIIAGAVIIRLEAGASADRIASVVRALATCQ